MPNTSKAISHGPRMASLILQHSLTAFPMSLSRLSPPARPPSPNSTPWPVFPGQSSSSAPVDIHTISNTRQGHSPTRSPKKMKGRPRQERNAEEDIKFNVGPKSPRAMLARRLMRRTRPERVIDPYTMDIPNYPPPSFQEATSGCPTSISPVATVSPTLPAIEIADTNPREEETENQTGFSHANGQGVEHQVAEHQVADHRTSSTFDSDSSSSDSSHDFCDVPGARRNMTQASPHRKNKEPQRGLAFPSTPLRGRNKSRAVLHDDLEVEECVAPPVASTRRHNSLSPLRTLFPSLHFTLHDRAASAHPTTEPTNEPYPLSRGISSFFRSTTSLALLHNNGNTTPTSLKSKTSLTNLSSHGSSPKRKLFSPSKGKERERVERFERSERPEKVEIDPDTDQLDTWEVINTADAVEPGASSSPNKEDKNKESKRNSPQATEMPTIDPFKRPTEATHAAPVGVTMEASQPQPPPVQSQSPAVHPLSLRDRKAHIPPVDRTPRTPTQSTPLPQPVPPRPHSPSVVAPPPLRAVQSQESPKPNSGSPTSNARVTRKQTAGATHTLTTKKSQVFNSSPLGIQTWRAGDESPTRAANALATGSEADPSLQTALETPLPPTPTDGVGSARSNANFSNELQTVMAEIAGLQFEPLTDTFATTAGFTGGSHSGGETPTKKHYHGRPLPPAPVQTFPSTRSPIDSVYLTNSSRTDLETTSEERDASLGTSCPEGLLIDLDDNTFVSGVSPSEITRSHSDLFSPLAPPASPTPLTVTGYPMIGYGHGHRGHLTPASMSTPNLASRPIYPSPLQLVSTTPDQGQNSPRLHTWTPLCTMTTDPRWVYDYEVDEEPPEYEALRFWTKPPLSFTASVKNVPPSPHLTHHVPHVPPFALALARAQTHPAPSSGVVPIHTNGR